MDSLRFYEDQMEGSEEGEEPLKLQPEFSEVTMVVETQETVEVEVVQSVDFRGNENEEEDGFPYIDDRSNVASKELNAFQKGEEESVELRSEGLEDTLPLDHHEYALVDLNRETCDTDLNLITPVGDELMTEQDEAILGGDTDPIEDAVEGSAMLEQTESVGKHVMISGVVANGCLAEYMDGSEVRDREAEDQQPPVETATAASHGRSGGEYSLEVPALNQATETVPAVSDGRSGGENSLEAPAPIQGIETVPAVLDGRSGGENSLEAPASIQGIETVPAVSDGRSGGENSLEVPGAIQAAASAQDEAFVNSDAGQQQAVISEHVDTGGKENTSILGDENDKEDDVDQAGNSSRSKEGPDVMVDLGSASTSPPLFNDANLAQLQAQILVMGILRKGSKPSEDLLKSACPASCEVGGPALGDPSSSKEQKSLENVAAPLRMVADTSGNVGIATDLMMTSVKENLNLSCDASEDALLLDDTDRQLRSAQRSAHDAMTTATSALAQSHLAWAQIRSEDFSESGIAREAQIASVAATVAAAASVAKAAVEAAKAIANVSIKSFWQGGGQIVNGKPIASQSKGKEQLTSAKNQKFGMLASVVKAAGMAPEAATQAGTVLALANPLMQSGGTGVNVLKRKASPITKVVKKSKASASASPKATPKATPRATTKAAPRATPKATPRVTPKASPKSTQKATPKATPRATTKAAPRATPKATPRVTPKASPKSTQKATPRVTPTDSPKSTQKATPKATPRVTPKASPKSTQKATPKATPASPRLNKGKVSPKTTVPEVEANKKKGDPAKEKEAEEDKSGEGAKRPKTQKVGVDTNVNSERIAKDSAVEVMTDEEGLRGGWFTGKVLRVTKSQAFVVYDEILDDDGKEKLQEWFPFKASGDCGGPRRQVRPVHPYSPVREADSKKRRRVALGSQTWIVGDHVDAFIQDGWWEGVVQELHDLDDSKITIYFSGEDDTQTLKTWDLRPSMQWENDKWVPWVDPTVTEGETRETLGKVGSSSSKAKKEKPVKGNVPESQKTKKHSRKVEDLNNKVDEPTPTISTRKRKVPEVSAKATHRKKASKKVENSSEKVDKLTPTRSTRKSPDGKQQDNTKSAKDSSQKFLKMSDITKGSGRNTKVPSKAPHKGSIAVGSPKAAKIIDSPEVATIRTRGKIKAEEQDKKRPKKR